jgi:hypothetical protein
MEENSKKFGKMLLLLRLLTRGWLWVVCLSLWLIWSRKRVYPSLRLRISCAGWPGLPDCLVLNINRPSR